MSLVDRSQCTTTQITALINALFATQTRRPVYTVFGEGFLEDQELDKRKHYQKLVVNACSRGGVPGEVIDRSVSEWDPLGGMGIDLIPAVATPFLTFGKAWTKCFKTLAKQKANIDGGEMIVPPTEMYLKDLAKRYSQQFKAEMTVALAKSVALSFPFDTDAPNRILVEQVEQQDRVRAGRDFLRRARGHRSAGRWVRVEEAVPVVDTGNRSVREGD
jgi:hypothetical protein